MKINRVLLFSFLIIVPSFSMALASDSNVIWQIGRPDRDFSEFALAGIGGNDQYLARFPADVNFNVGKDDPAKQWSYVHPGSADAWAGSKSHTFTVNFDIEDKKYVAYVINIHLTSSHNSLPPELTIWVNDMERQVQTSAGPGDQALTDAKAGGQQSYSIIFRPEMLKNGKNQVKIVNSKGSWMLYDAVELVGFTQLDDFDTVKVLQKQGWYQRPEGDCCLLELQFEGGILASPAQVVIVAQGRTIQQTIDPGEDILQSAKVYVPLDYSKIPVNAQITIKTSGKTVKVNAEIKPARKWQIHLVHQTHLDIGYTHTQEDVLKRQVDHLYNALAYIKASENLPEIERFKWHPEGMWAVEEFLRIRPESEKKEFIERTRQRNVHIDALYAQAMTGAYSEEELFELIGAAARYGRENGVDVNSAMQTDVPGYTWGIVNALAHHGVKYMSAGPNWGHRVGHTFELADQPFYWKSPCGENKILLWVSGRPYSWPIGSTMEKTFNKDEIDRYLDDLEEQGYPYDIVMIRYGMGGDNGPPNPMLPTFVKQWNDEYAWPKLIISRNSDVMAEMENRYGDQLPVLSGDFTPYWEDGMASTSADTGISRRAAEKLVQAQALWTMLDTEGFPHEKFELAWNKLIMYDEHTWGAHNSISAPDSDFAIRQAEYKQKYALDGASLTDELLARGIAPRYKKDSNIVDVFNTLNWDRSEVVFLQPVHSKAGDRVVDQQDRQVPSQRLADGRLAFLAEKIPAFGARRYFIRQGQAFNSDAKIKVTSDSLTNGSVKLVIDRNSGAINSIRCNGVNKNIVDNTKGYAVNDYLYIIGRDATKNNMRIESPVEVSIVDAGPLVGTLQVKSDAPGAKKLTRIVRMVHGSDIIELENLVDKLKERRPEGVYFDFPFNVPDGIMKIDTPWAVFEPEKEQLIAANRNFFCVQRYVDISNADYGVTWISVDAPIVQWDPIKIAGANGTHYFRRTINPNQCIHSWVMNNHWETNYKADQEGLIPFKYAIWPHAGGYDASSSQRLSRSVHQPLIAVTTVADKPVIAPSIKVDGKGIVVTSLKPCRDGKGYMVRLFNTHSDVSHASVKLRDDGSIWESNPFEDKLSKVEDTLKMKSQEIITLRIE
ncbi:MAG: hypothetical protein JEZ07_14020 [Phycisphaerae bacterium]|nr:hypothetical protein [Phycisphaerae bacterium]